MGKGLAQHLADLHLHQVTGDDVFAGHGHGGQIVFLRKRALDGRMRGMAATTHHQVLGSQCCIAHPHAQLMQPLAGLAIGFGLGRIGIDDEIDHAAEVVDDGQLVHHQQQQVGHADGVGFLDIADLGLDEVHHVVAKIAGQTTTEARQPGQQVDAVAALVLLHEGQRIALDGLDHLAITHHLDMGALGADGGPGRQADEGIASEALAPHHGFEQEGISTVGGIRQLEIEAERTVQIGQRLQHDRDAVIALCCQRLEFEFGHLRCLGKICRTGKSIPVCRHMDVSPGNTCSRTTSPCAPSRTRGKVETVPYGFADGAVGVSPRDSSSQVAS